MQKKRQLPGRCPGPLTQGGVPHSLDPPLKKLTCADYHDLGAQLCLVLKSGLATPLSWGWNFCMLYRLQVGLWPMPRCSQSSSDDRQTWYCRP